MVDGYATAGGGGGKGRKASPGPFVSFFVGYIRVGGERGEVPGDRSLGLESMLCELLIVSEGSKMRDKIGGKEMLLSLVNKNGHLCVVVVVIINPKLQTG